MNGISFCITTSGTNDAGIQTVIDSVKALNIPNYEIIYVVSLTTTIAQTDIVKHLPFDETVKAHVTLHGHA